VESPGGDRYKSRTEMMVCDWQWWWWR